MSATMQLANESTNQALSANVAISLFRCFKTRSILLKCDMTQKENVGLPPFLQDLVPDILPHRRNDFDKSSSVLVAIETIPIFVGQTTTGLIYLLPQSRVFFDYRFRQGREEAGR